MDQKAFEYFNTLLPQTIGSKIGSIAPQIVPSAAFGYQSAEEAEAIFSGHIQKPLYARMGHPTQERLAEVLCAMEDGQGAIGASSGMGALAMVLSAFCEAGDEVLGVGGFFGGSYTLIKETMCRFGVRSTFCDVDAIDEIEERLREGVKMVLLESVGNPNLKLPDLPKIAQLCKAYQTLLVVDNTLTPLLLAPLRVGADIVIYSTTKIISGHSAALGGAVVYRAVQKDHEKLLHPRYEALHAMVQKGPGAIGMILKKRALRDFGMSPNAFGVFLTLLGMETLALRMWRVNENVAKIADRLARAGVAVRHPSLTTHEHHDRFRALYQEGCGPLLTIECAHKAQAFALLDATKLITQTANVGDNRTLGLHMASTIYRDFDQEARAFLGVSEGLVRFSIGIESADMIVEDLLQAWKKSCQA